MDYRAERPSGRSRTSKRTLWMFNNMYASPLKLKCRELVMLHLGRVNGVGKKTDRTVKNAASKFNRNVHEVGLCSTEAVGSNCAVGGCTALWWGARGVAQRLVQAVGRRSLANAPPPPSFHQTSIGQPGDSFNFPTERFPEAGQNHFLQLPSDRNTLPLADGMEIFRYPT